MRIREIRAKDIPPVKRFEVDNLSDVVVVAGPNGVGKTRLIDALLGYFQNLSGSNVSFLIESTHKDETASWGKTTLNTSNQQDAQLLKGTLHQNRRRRNFRSSVFYYESNRSIQKIQPLAYQWDIPDPWEEQVSWNMTFGGLQNRFQDTQHAIFKKLQSQKTGIANRAIALKREGQNSMNLDFSDPLDPFRDAFFQLLAPKTLESPDVQGQTLRYKFEGQSFDFSALSSGEREVINVTFDFILRQPSHCIVFLDEPELHLHPELSAKLISTLKAVGEHNQFVLCSHSPDIISSSLEDSVIFLTPPKSDGGNQGLAIHVGDETAEALHRLGQSVGVVSLGKKIVLIEGTDASLDKKTYTHILKNRFPTLVLLPSGGKGTLKSFNAVVKEVLDRTIWGVEFFMLADRDVSPAGNSEEAMTQASTGRFRTLSRYHLENYFLDPLVLAEVFKDMDPAESWLRSSDEIEKVLREIARSQVSYATALISAKFVRDSAGNADIMPKGCNGKTAQELVALMSSALEAEHGRLGTALDPQATSARILQVFESLSAAVDAPGNKWSIDIPGKPIFRIFCNRAGLSEGRLKTLYIQKAEQLDTNPFDEIIQILGSFASNERGSV